MNLTPIDYRARQARAAAEVGDGALLVLSQPQALRNSTNEHAWRQESFFYYLTGFEEPEAALLILGFKPAGERVHLFLRDKDPERELWEGRRLGLKEAAKTLAIDTAHQVRDLWEKFPDLLGEASRVYFHLGLSPEYDREFIQALARHKGRYGKKHLSCKIPVHDSMYVAGRLRLHKTADEVARMRAAAGVTRRAFDKLYRSVRPGMNEREAYGLILGEFLAGGAEMEAYGSIVAGGANACILHYRENNMPLKDGELLLVDAGSQYEYYASDVTRTFPVGKRFSPEQRAAYDIVLAAQKAAIAQATVRSSLPAIHDTAISVLVDGMLDLRLLTGSKDEIIAKGLFRAYYPHGTSHWIGMDVHDVGVYQEGGEPMRLAPGMYFSVEPGLYIPPTDDKAPKGLRGVGIRIEDDVLVTANGPEVITAEIAKEVFELENRY